MSNEQKSSILDSLNRLRWACRRGMLELDVLLSGFLNDRFLCLNVSQKAQFASLLTYQDPEIFDWLMGQSRPSNEGLASIVDEIRSHAKSRF